jgi:hypothetical protein
MITQERETSTEILRYKVLDLISPEKAREIGIPAEAPVFVALFSNMPWQCRECDEVFKPIAFQTGHQVSFHHVHEGWNGMFRGIYYRLWSRNSSQLGNFGAVAILEPSRIIRGSEADLEEQVESVEVKKIRLYCFHCNPYIKWDPMKETFDNFRQRTGIKFEELREGIVVSFVESPDELIPVCRELFMEKPEAVDRFEIRFEFTVTDSGEVLFSSI